MNTKLVCALFAFAIPWVSAQRTISVPCDPSGIDSAVKSGATVQALSAGSSNPVDFPGAVYALCNPGCGGPVTLRPNSNSLLVTKNGTVHLVWNGQMPVCGASVRINDPAASEGTPPPPPPPPGTIVGRSISVKVGDPVVFPLATAYLCGGKPWVPSEGPIIFWKDPDTSQWNYGYYGNGVEATTIYGTHIYKSQGVYNVLVFAEAYCTTLSNFPDSARGNATITVTASAGAERALSGSRILPIGHSWCDGKMEHQEQALSYTMLGPGAKSEVVGLRWDELTGGGCTALSGGKYVKITASEARTEENIVQIHQQRFGLRQKSIRHAADGICVCGYNTRVYCDAGGYQHYVSDCFDDDGNNCGYDDQASGRCQ